MNVLKDVQTDKTYQPSTHLPKSAPRSRPTAKHKKFSLFKADYLHIKELEILLENLQTMLGMNPH